MKILVLRFSSIGDIVLTTAVVRCLKRQIPGAQIHYLTKKSFENILYNNENVDELITFEKKTDEVLTRLKSEKYDCIVDLHNNIRTLKLKAKLRVKSYTFPKKNISKFLLTTFKINKMPKIHVVDRYFKAVEKLGVHNDCLPNDYFLTNDDIVDLKADGLESKKFLAVAMGTQFETKLMPLDLMEKVLKDSTIPLVLLGGKNDIERSEELKKRLKTQQIIDFCGKLTLGQSAFMCKEASQLLTGDTGLMHIAACFETPIVSVWGNTVPDLGMYPYVPQKEDGFTIHEVEGLKCRPCSKIGYHACPKGHFNCMNLQNVDEIKSDLFAHK